MVKSYGFCIRSILLKHLVKTVTVKWDFLLEYMLEDLIPRCMGVNHFV